MKLALTDTRNIIFDLGNVLLNLDFEASIQAFHKLGLRDDIISSQQAYSDPAFLYLETGRISPEIFRERVRELLRNPGLSDEQIDNAWYAMIGDIPAKRVEVLKQLRKKYRVFLFSNTNAIHIGRLMPTFNKIYGFEFSSLFDAVFYSHEINDRKPELSAFKKVIDLSGVLPEESLFVDDIKQNVDAAGNAGLKTLWLQPGMEMADLF